MAVTPLVTRFAPSPTGLLHAGHAYAAWFAWQRARDTGGRFLLRVEDIDTTRCRSDYADAIQQDLRWLGLDWDGDIRVQSAHLAAYQAALERLRDRGVLYQCFCTRAEIAAAHSAPHGTVPAYPGTCRHLPAAEAAARAASGAAYAWRLDAQRASRQAGALRYFEADEGWIEIDPTALDDAVLGRKDVAASYHLCVVHDDAAQGVTLVTRGEDLRAATPVQVLLGRLLDLPAPAYAHHRLIMDTSGRRLAKRDKAVTLRALREAGIRAADIMDDLAGTHERSRMAKIPMFWRSSSSL